MIADRIVQVDHMTKGRAMLGIGPGQLVRDTEMIGLDPMNNRTHLAKAFEAAVRLLKGEKVTMKTVWYDLRDAVLQMAPTLTSTSRW